MPNHLKLSFTLPTHGYFFYHLPYLSSLPLLPACISFLLLGTKRGGLGLAGTLTKWLQLSICNKLATSRTTGHFLSMELWQLVSGATDKMVEESLRSGSSDQNPSAPPQCDRRGLTDLPSLLPFTDLPRRCLKTQSRGAGAEEEQIGSVSFS